MPQKKKIAIIGLGYVGLPLAIEFAKKYKVVGFDTNFQRIEELSNGIDQSQEADLDELRRVVKSKNSDFGLILTTSLSALKDCNVYIITVPTPIDEFKAPNLKPLLLASKMVGNVLKQGDLVIYESTVYPGCTEADCVPVLEQVSGLKFNLDFFCGYSPERINPGDKINTLTKIIKVTSGSTPEVAVEVNDLYKSIITSGTYLAPSMAVAEASKAIENAQRDVNISFVNELALIFDRMNIDTSEVLAAAATKWNFLNYKPGLVGGHCIGVDPYYLAHKSESLGYTPEVILSGRRVNDNMGSFVAQKLIKLMIAKGKTIKDSKILILGFAFKENCPDTRNTKVIDIYNELKEYSAKVSIYDPWVNVAQVQADYHLELLPEIGNVAYDAMIIAVAHQEFLEMNFDDYHSGGTVIYDTKSFIDKSLVHGRL